MVVNGEDYYYLPGVAKVIKVTLGRDDLKKDDVPEVLAGLNYDYDANTIPYQTHGKTISLYKKSSIPELLNLPGNRYKAIQLISKIVARQKGVNVFATKPIMGRVRPNRKNNVSVRESMLTLEEYNVSHEVQRDEPIDIKKVYVHKSKPENFLVFDGRWWYSINDGDIKFAVGDKEMIAVNGMIKGLKMSYGNKNIPVDVTFDGGRFYIRVTKGYDTHKGDVDRWMAKYGYMEKSYLSSDYCMVYEVRYPEPSDTVKEQLGSYNDITDEYFNCKIKMRPIMVLQNLDKIYNHIVNCNTIYNAGSRSAGMSYVPPGLYVIGKMRNDYPVTNSKLMSFSLDDRLVDQYIIGYGFIDGVYKLRCGDKSALMVAFRDNESFYKYKAYLFYPDDDTIDVKRLLNKYVNESCLYRRKLNDLIY